MMRPNKLEGLPLETLSKQSSNLRARPESTQLEDLSDASFLGKLLVIPANVRLDWKVIAGYKRSSLFGLVISNEEVKFYTLSPELQLLLLLEFGGGRGGDCQNHSGAKGAAERGLRSQRHQGAPAREEAGQGERGQVPQQPQERSDPDQKHQAGSESRI